MTQGNYPSQELKHSQLPAPPTDKAENNEVIPRPVNDESDDNEENEDPLDLIVYNNNNDIANNAQFNITSSQNVVIGNVTHVHGVLTINQNSNGNKISINSEEEAAKTKDVQFLSEPKLIVSANTVIRSTNSSKAQLIEDPPQTRALTKFQNYYKRLRYIFLSIVILLLITFITIPFVLKSRSKHNYPIIETTTPFSLSSSTSPKNEEFLGTHKLMYREDWQGYPMKNNTKVLKHPTKTVIISHSVTPFCTSKVDCSLNVRGMQDHHISTYGSPDVGYNFMIGGDGNIYVGRGWDIVNFQEDGTIAVNFIGNFVHDELTESMIDAAERLLDQGVKLKKLSNDYEIISHNTTMATQSPGPNVFKIIKTWPHFSAKNFVKPE